MAVVQGVAQFEENMAQAGFGRCKWVIPNRGNDDRLHFYVYTLASSGDAVPLVHREESLVADTNHQPAMPAVMHSSISATDLHC